MFRYSPILLSVSLVAGVLAEELRADLVPIPRAYYDFEEIVDGKFQNVIMPGVFDGYLGLAADTTERNPSIVSGLFGSNYALQFTSSQIARVPTLVTNTNPGVDRIDEDVFSGAFTVFARIVTPNVTQMNVMNVDRGPLTTDVRGWYLDFNGNTDGKLHPRINNGPYYNPSGTDATYYEVVESIGISWNPDPEPGGAAQGSFQMYINGLPFGSPVSHNMGSVYVGEAGFNIGFGQGVSGGNGITIDDVAIWDVALTSTEMFSVHTEGVPVPEPGIWGLLVLAGMALTAWRPARHIR